MDPHWPVPKKISVTFDDEEGSHEASLITGIDNSFQGHFTIAVVSSNREFSLILSTNGPQ
jgi:hypothetical protein